MPVPHDALISLWETALAAEIGIAVPSNERRQLAVELYNARQESEDERFMELTIQQPAKSNELWICHKAVEIPEDDNG